MEVHKVMGAGFLELVYHEALALEFQKVAPPIDFKHEVELPLFYKGQQLATRYRADFLCFGNCLLLELKAKKTLIDEDRAQILNYLKSSRIAKGLLLNFGSPSLQFERFILTPRKE